MLKIAFPTSALLLLASCHGNNGQAAALDRAAGQSDPAAAATLRNEADAIRANGTDTNSADPDAPAQAALAKAGSADVTHPAASTPTTPPSGEPGAMPHKAGQPVPGGTTPTPVTKQR